MSIINASNQQPLQIIAAQFSHEGGFLMSASCEQVKMFKSTFATDTNVGGRVLCPALCIPNYERIFCAGIQKLSFYFIFTRRSDIFDIDSNNLKSIV